MTTIASLLERAKATLSLKNESIIEAQMLLTHVLSCERSTLYAHPEKNVSEEEQQRFEALVQRRKQGEPIAYLLGTREFWSLPFKVTQDTLIPRHETELLVQVVLDSLPNTALKLVDVGTGCGAIACALAHERKNWEILALDVSEKAIEVATFNAKHLNLSNVRCIHSNWLEAVKEESFDAIIGNPPYIRGDDVHLIHGDLPFEPTLALTPGPSGLEAFRLLLEQSNTCLKAGGLIAFEHGFDQGAQLQALFKEYDLEFIRTFLDASGNERVTTGKTHLA